MNEYATDIKWTYQRSFGRGSRNKRRKELVKEYYMVLAVLKRTLYI